MSSKETRLYNIFFPIWMILLIPTAWMVALPINFIVDSIVILISMRAMKIANKKTLYKKSILKVWIFGFIADIIGALCIFGAMYFFKLDIRGDELFLTIPALLISAIFIFIFNYAISFKSYEKGTRLRMAMHLAIFTAPYTFLIPLNWIYY